MLLSFLDLAVPLVTTAAFLAGGAAGIALTRFAGSRHAAPTRSRVEGGGNPAMGATPVAEGMRHTGPLMPDTPALAKRMGTGHQPLPQRVTELPPVDPPTMALVNVFVDRLAELPVTEWLNIGRQQIADGALAAKHATAIAILKATIGTKGRGLAAWSVRDAVETSVFLATNRVPRWTRTERRIFAAARAAAEDAALALLARDSPVAAEFATLFAPFDHVLSNDQLTHLSTSGDVKR